MVLYLFELLAVVVQVRLAQLMLSTERLLVLLSPTRVQDLPHYRTLWSTCQDLKSLQTVLEQTSQAMLLITAHRLLEVEIFEKVCT